MSEYENTRFALCICSPQFLMANRTVERYLRHFIVIFEFCYLLLDTLQMQVGCQKAQDPFWMHFQSRRRHYSRPPCILRAPLVTCNQISSLSQDQIHPPSSFCFVFGLSKRWILLLSRGKSSFTEITKWTAASASPSPLGMTVSVEHDGIPGFKRQASHAFV